MKKTLLICLALLCALTLCACNAEKTPQEQQTYGDTATEAPGKVTTEATVHKPAGNAPDFIVLDGESNAVQLSDFAGKPVVLNFWATWCGYCKLEMPDFDQAYKEYPDVVFMMINATDGVYETKQTADAYVQSQGFSFDVYYDVSGLAQNAYNLSGYPTTVFIDANGDVVRTEIGMISYDTLVQGIALINQ